MTAEQLQAIVESDLEMIHQTAERVRRFDLEDFTQDDLAALAFYLHSV